MLKKYYLKSCELLFLIFPISIVFSNFFANLTVYYLAILGIYVAVKKIHISKIFLFFVNFLVIYFY